MKKIFLCAVLCVCLFSCTHKQEAKTEYIFGTFCTINAFEAGTQKLYDEIFARLFELDAILSANTTTSNIAEINSFAGISPVLAHKETLYVLNFALDYSDKTQGALDPTVGPLVKIWNIGSSSAKVPSQEEIQTATQLINYKKVQIDSDNQTVFLTDPKMALDLGAIAKGYAADEVVKILEKHKIKRALIDLGGNVYAFGKKQNGDAWNVGLRDPLDDTGKPIASIAIVNQSVVTSGVYERYFEKDGVNYHHILNTTTGYPTETDLVAVTIISSSSILADTLSTSIFVLGEENGKNLLNTIPNVEVIFIYKNKHIKTTDGIKKNLRLLAEDYTLID